MLVIYFNQIRSLDPFNFTGICLQLRFSLLTHQNLHQVSSKCVQMYSELYQKTNKQKKNQVSVLVEVRHLC